MEAKSFVRTSLRQGKLEAASLAEYEDVRSGDGTHEPDSVGHQEHLVREAARSGAPYISPDTEETIAKIASDGAEEQEEAPEEGEEQEEQQEEEQPPPPPAKKAPAKKKAAAKKASAKKAAAKKKS